MVYIGSNTGGKAHLYDLFVRHSRQENILLVVVRVEPNHVRYFSVAEAIEALAGFSIPEFHLSVITTGQEIATVVREREIFDGLYVSMESPQAVPVSVNVPQLEALVQSSRTPNAVVTLTLILVSIEPLRKRCPVFGRTRITETPCV